jgi:7-carboxy-7-deazaguanine synthase
MNRVLPIAETFHSLQGEGQWVGTPMFFLRLAGCNVGRPAKALKVEGPFPILQTGQEAKACTTWDGRIFPCDTDYEKHEELRIEDVLHQVWEQHICITGGEPFLHADLIYDLYREVLDKRPNLTIHVETSGTLLPLKISPIKTRLILPGIWITCAPKVGCLDAMIQRSDELKILVDNEFNEERMTLSMLCHKNVFICPINGVDYVNLDNVDPCLKLLKKYPHWKVSVQMHKFLNLR